MSEIERAPMVSDTLLRNDYGVYCFVDIEWSRFNDSKELCMSALLSLKSIT